MSWEAMAAIGEAVGAAGVMVTLIYLAHQLRLNTRTVKASATKDAQDSWADLNDYLAQNPRLAVIANKIQGGEVTAHDLSPEEYAQFTFVLRSLFQKLEGQYFMYKSGLLEPAMWRTRLDWTAAFLQAPFVRDFWHQEQHTNYSREFLRELERGEPSPAVYASRDGV